VRPSPPARSASSSSIDAGYTNIVAVGFAYASVGARSPRPTRTSSSRSRRRSTDSKGDNIENITFAEHEGSFLVGAAAALKSKSRPHRLRRWRRVDLIKKFEAGYVAGAKAVNPDIKIESKYLTQPPDFSGFVTRRQGQDRGRGHVPERRRRRLPRRRWLRWWRLHRRQGRGLGHRCRLRPGLTSPARRPRRHPHLDAQEGRRRRLRLHQVGQGRLLQVRRKVFDLKVNGVGYATTGGQVDDIKPKLDDYKARSSTARSRFPTNVTLHDPEVEPARLGNNEPRLAIERSRGPGSGPR
jgi:basic membrane protein A